MSADGLFPAPAPRASGALPDGVTLSARVPAELRERVLANRLPGEDQSAVVRRLLRSGLEVGATVRSDSGARRRHGGPAEAAAAIAAAALTVAPRVGSQRFRALKVIADAGVRGATADEVVAALAPLPHNGIARRVTDLLQGGFIAPALWREAEPGHPHVDVRTFGIRRVYAGEDRLGDEHVGRRTRAGALGTVYVLTSPGLTALYQARRSANA